MSKNLSDLSADSLSEILLKLPPRDILNMCILDKKFKALCDKNYLWKQLLGRDFPNDKDLFSNENFKSEKDLYKFLFGLKVLKQKLKLKESLYELYHLQILNLDNDKLTSLPREIGALKRLENLYLNNNQLTSLPREIGALKRLEVLSLNNNQLTSLPREIGNLKNLQILYLYNNQLSSLPPEIGALMRLDILQLSWNQFTEKAQKEIQQLLPNTNIKF